MTPVRYSMYGCDVAVAEDGKGRQKEKVEDSAVVEVAKVTGKGLIPSSK